jgi:hypothetical protein
VDGDGQSAIEFLRWAQPGGPWTLTAIPPDDGRTTTRTFLSDNEAGLLEWLAGFNGKQNVYWTINRLRGPATSKPKKEDVDALLFLHVDVDPVKGRDLEVERRAILDRLQAFRPEPSAIIDSGGGYQAFWRLDEALYFGGDVVRIGEAEAYNQQLEVLLGGDHCFNVDRILRLPGTVNLPNAKKRKNGRVEALAAVVVTTDRVWGLSEFTPAQKVQEAGRVGPAAVKLSGNLAPVLIDDLPERVTQRTRMLIVQGDDPDDPTRYGSRSDVVFAVACELARAGCDDDTIASVLLDPDYGVSGHVRAQRRSAEYAARQIQRAREQVEEPMLRELNEKHAIIADLGGKCRVISEVLDMTMERPRVRISKQSFDDFRNRYMHIKVEVGKTKDGDAVYKAAGAWWLGHSLRRQYTSLIFAPGREVDDAFNLWQGFACEAIPGEGHQLFLEHIRDNVCSGNEDHYCYLLGWMARAVQHPGQAGEVAVVLRGGRGTGKGTFINGFGQLWGRHFLQVSSAKHLVGQFNAHLRDCVVLFADEAFFAGDRQHESVLKTLITEDTLVVEGKGVDAEVAANYTHLLMSSNEHWVVPAGADERRFFVLDVADAKKQDNQYFGRVRAALDGGGRESLLHFLLTLDLTAYDVRKVPQTEALREQKLFSMTVEQAWWLERLMDGRITAQSAEWSGSILKERIQADYLRYAEAQRIMRRSSPTALGRFLNRVMPGEYPISVQRTTDVEKDDGQGRTYTARERVYYYDLPTLQACRDEWDRLYGGSFGWPKEEVEAISDRPEPY